MLTIISENMDKIIEHYNKFNEDKRLKSRHGQVEFQITMKYIGKMLEQLKNKRPGARSDNSDIKILDIGAGTGAYSVPLAEEGFSVTAVELVKHNLMRMKNKSDKVIAKQGNALNLSKLQADTYDLVLLFGPLYHLFTKEEKCKALSEAKRVLKPDGILMAAYLMNDYGVIMYGFNEGHLLECYHGYRLDLQFHCHSKEEDLYDFVTIQDINSMNELCGLKRQLIFTPDGPTNYIRPTLKKMNEQEFEIYLKYVESIAERQDMIGAGAHTVDILCK